MNPGLFFAELKRRKVFRVAGAYAVVTFVVLQAGDILIPALRLPEWTMSLIVLLAILGFPVALVLAWAFEVTPEGVTRTHPDGSDAHAGERPGAGPHARVGRGPGYVGLGIIIALVGFGAYAYLGPSAGTTFADPGAVPSIAVLPFADMSPEGDQEYFSDGITEDILTKLARLPGLRVISRTSVMQYKGTDKTIPDIARELGVGYVLEGSVRKAGEQVRITGQLIRAATDEHLWAESYDRELTDVFQIQSDIATRIAEALEVHLSAGERSRVEKNGTGSIDAYELYLKGREYFRRAYASTADLRSHYSSAIALFRQAIALDPDYALAHAGLARAYRLHPDIRAEAKYDSAAAFARTAIALDPDLPEGYVELGKAYELRDEDSAALEQFRHAVELNPNNADAIAAIAMQHWGAGRLDEALRDFKRAVAVDPAIGDRYGFVADIYLALREYDLAVEWYRRGIGEVMAHPARLSYHLAVVDLFRGDTAAARAHLRESLRLERSSYIYASASWAAVMLGDYADADAYAERALNTEEALLYLWLNRAYVALRNDSPEAKVRLQDAEAALLDAVEAEGPSEYTDQLLAALAALRGDDAAAVRLLEDSYTRGARNVDELRQWPWFDELRSDPALRRLFARMDADIARMRARVEREGW